MAELPALVRPVVHGAVRSAVHGEADTGDARSAGATSRGAARSWCSRPARARRALRRARRATPTRGAYGGRATDAVDDDEDGGGPATAVSAASRRASGARSDRRERRREGYPPEGPRLRSGLGRVARSRSDAPRFTLPFGTPVSIFGASGMTSTGNTAGSSILVTIDRRAGIVGGDTGTMRGNIIVVWRAVCGEGAAKRRRVAVAVSDQKGDRAAGVATRPVVAMRLRRRRAGPGCRVRRPCRRGCR